MQTNDIAVSHTRGPVPPTHCVDEPEGTITEIYDVPLFPADMGVAHDRVLRLPQLAELSQA